MRVARTGIAVEGVSLFHLLQQAPFFSCPWSALIELLLVLLAATPVRLPGLLAWGHQFLVDLRKMMGSIAPKSQNRNYGFAPGDYGESARKPAKPCEALHIGSAEVFCGCFLRISGFSVLWLIKIVVLGVTGSNPAGHPERK